MGSDYQQSGSQSPLQTLAAYSQYLPSLTQSAAAQSPGVAQQQLLAANQLVNPTNPADTAKVALDNANAQLAAATAAKNSGQMRSAQDAVRVATANYNTAKSQGTPLGTNALNLDQLQKYALPEAQVGQQVADSNAQAGAATNLKQIQGAGGQAAQAAQDLNRQTNTGYYTAQDAASKGAAAGVNAINLNGLSPGEAAATERSLNQTNTSTGNAGLVNPTNVVNNAMNFGGAFNSKIGLMNNATAAATGAANSGSSNGGFNAVNVALGQPNTSTASNMGAGQFSNSAGTGTGASGNAFSFGNGLLGNMTSGNNAAMGAGASMANATSPASYLGSVCCFIFLEAYHGKLPRHVRRGRDLYYKANPDIAAGYRRMARWLVPLMQQNNFIRSLVWKFMVFPITMHLAHPTNGYRKSLTHFWLRLWSITGRNKEERYYNMPWRYQYVW